MDMEEIFRIQLNIVKPVTEEELNKREYKHYFNGEEIKVGDIVLYCIMSEVETTSTNDLNELETQEIFDGNIDETDLKLNMHKTIKNVLVAINPRHFDLLTIPKLFVDFYENGQDKLLLPYLEKNDRNKNYSH